MQVEQVFVAVLTGLFVTIFNVMEMDLDVNQYVKEDQEVSLCFTEHQKCLLLLLASCRPV